MRIQGRSLTVSLVLLALIAWARPAAAQFGDCAPVGTLENFDAVGKPDTSTWNALEFRVMDGKNEKTVEKYGRSCHQTYSLKSGLTSSNLEIMKNYAEGLPDLGFAIANTDRAEDDQIHASRIKDGVETWVRVYSSNSNTISVFVLDVQPFKPSLAQAGAEDCPPLVGLDRFEPVGKPVTRTFAEESFHVVDGKDAKNVERSGKTCHQVYALKTGAPATGNLEIITNYAVALPAQGFRIVNTNRDETDEIDGTMTKDGVETWVRIYPSNGNTVSMAVLTVEPFRSTLSGLGPMDCPLVPSIANFVAGAAPQTRTFAEETFRVMDGQQSKVVAKAGQTCRQVYSLRSGLPDKSNLEIIRNYAEGLPAAGFSITNTNRDPADEVFATLDKDGVETWIHVYPSNGNVVSVLVLQIVPFKTTLAALGPKDCPLVPSLENFDAAGEPGTRTFDRVDFRVDDGGGAKTVTKDGKSCRQTYGLKSGVANKTNLEIMRNYAEGLPAAGFAIANTKRDPADEVVATIVRDGVERWVRVYASNGNTISAIEVEVARFVPSIAPPGPNDCPLVPSLVDFAASGPPSTRPYDSMEFRTFADGKPKPVAKAGKTCRQTYGEKSGLPRKTNLEIAMNYAEALPAAGFAIANTDRGDDDAVVATMTKDGTESWVEVAASNGNSIAVKVLRIEPFK